MAFGFSKGLVKGVTKTTQMLRDKVLTEEELKELREEEARKKDTDFFGIIGNPKAINRDSMQAAILVGWYIYITVPNMDYEEPAEDCSCANEYSGIHYDAVNDIYLDDSEPDLEEPLMDEETEEMMRRSDRLSGEFCRVQEGDARNIRSVPLTKYWEQAKQ